jgi:hypothetical protein
MSASHLDVPNRIWSSTLSPNIRHQIIWSVNCLTRMKECMCCVMQSVPQHKLTSKLRLEPVDKVHTFLASRFSIRRIIATSMNVSLLCTFRS